MGEFTKIAWTDHTFNPWIGCQKVSPGCDHCYAEAFFDHRFHKVQWGPHGKRKRTSATNWGLPFKWASEAASLGKSARVFCASMADVFDNKVDPAWRTDLFDVIRMTPELDWQLLTKRPENIRKMLPGDWHDGYGNVWLGTTAEDQKHYDRRWSILRAIPAKLHFISYEPALGPLKIESKPGPYPDWVICGGESGVGARYMKPRWARNLRDECRELDISFFMKQMTGGKKTPIPPKLLVRQFPDRRRQLAA